MFKLNKMFSCIHVYVTLLNNEGIEVPRQVLNTIISESDDEWIGDELEQNQSEETDLSSCYINEEEWKKLYHY